MKYIYRAVWKRKRIDTDLLEIFRKLKLLYLSLIQHWNLLIFSPKITQTKLFQIWLGSLQLWTLHLMKITVYNMSPLEQNHHLFSKLNQPVSIELVWFFLTFVCLQTKTNVNKLHESEMKNCQSTTWAYLVQYVRNRLQINKYSVIRPGEVLSKEAGI